MIYSVKDLYQIILNRKPKGRTLLIGIDGGGGAGKSTLADTLCKLDPQNVTVVHMDDFYKTSKQRETLDNSIGWLWDCTRIKEQVLLPLKNEQEAKYQLYSWEEDKLSSWVNVLAGGVVIVEGCYSLINELNNFYDIKIWIETPSILRLSRGVERDGEMNRYLWEELWMPAEEQYISVQQPHKTADIVIDGSGEQVNISDFMVNIIRKDIV